MTSRLGSALHRLHLRLRPGFARRWRSEVDGAVVIAALMTLAGEEQQIIREMEAQGPDWTPFPGEDWDGGFTA